MITVYISCTIVTIIRVSVMARDMQVDLTGIDGPLNPPDVIGMTRTDSSRPMRVWQPANPASLTHGSVVVTMGMGPWAVVILAPISVDVLMTMLVSGGVASLSSPRDWGGPPNALRRRRRGWRASDFDAELAAQMTDGAGHDVVYNVMPVRRTDVRRLHLFIAMCMRLGSCRGNVVRIGSTSPTWPTGGTPIWRRIVWTLWRAWEINPTTVARAVAAALHLHMVWWDLTPAVWGRRRTRTFLLVRI